MPGIVFYVVDMNIKQIKNTLLGFLVFALSLTGASFVSDTAQAYKCTGTTSGGAAYYYKDGRCWEPYYDTSSATAEYYNASNNQCPGGSFVSGSTTNCVKYVCSGGAPAQSETSNCYTRNESKDQPGGNTPVNDDGTAVAEFECSNGGDINDDCKKRVCTTSGGRQTCRTDEGYKVPKGADPTSSNPNANLGYCTKKYVSSGIENLTKEKAACEAGQTGADCEKLAGSEKTACEDGKANPNPNSSNGNATQQFTGECGGAKTNLISCDGTGITALGNVLKQVLQILTVMIGIVAVGGIAYGAVMYASAQDNSGQTQKAIEVIRNVLIGILLYGFMVAIINWLIPGSVFG